MVVLKQRPSPRLTLARCPYCHDLLGVLAIQRCPGCETEHHVACVRELGRCSVHGCGRDLSGRTDDPHEWRDSPARRAVRRRMRARARSFVRRHVSPSGRRAALTRRPVRVELDEPPAPPAEPPIISALVAGAVNALDRVLTSLARF